MGFSVTIAHVIFFTAAITASSVAFDALWESTNHATEARQTWNRLSASQLDTNLTLTVNTCNSSCNPAVVPIIRIDVQNTGTTVVDYRNLTYLIDGVVYTIADVVDHDIVSPAAVSNTDLIIPGETMRIEFNDIPVTATYTLTTLPVQVVTIDGVIGRR